ncbi:MAG: PKD domain-containing protein, partial [Imperialibacter sp.]
INTSGDISSYSWDFDGDGIEDSTDPDPTFQYSSAGEYEVTLTVISSSGCNNTVSSQVSIYSSPIASFDPPVTNLCSNTPLSFINTSTFDVGSPVSWVWDFNGEGSSTDPSPNYAFDSGGEKTITLTATLADGCVNVAQNTINLVAGSPVGFSWSNNCFGSAVEMINTSETVGVSYEWNFGDGTPTSDVFEPTHTYLAANTYNLQLKVTNGSGCESILVKPIVVNDQALLDFSLTGELTQNVPLQFIGEDKSTFGDQVVSWSWDFAGLGIGSDQTEVFSFGTPATYAVSLAVTTEQGCVDELTKDVTIAPAERPTAGFTLDVSLCLGESLQLGNETLNGVSYQWDFCQNGLEHAGAGTTALNIGSLSSPEGFEVVTEYGMWYGFLFDRTSSKLYRLEFGNSLVNVPTQVEIGTLGGVLSGPAQIRLVKEGSSWYGLVANFGSSTLVRLNFGSSVTGTPTAVSLGTLGLNGPRGLTVKWDGSKWLVFVTNFNGNNIKAINFGGSITNNPVIGDVSTLGTGAGLSGPLGISIGQSAGNWYGLVASYNNSKMYHMSFGAVLSSVPVFSELGTVSLPTDVQLVKDGLNYYGLISGSAGVYRYQFGATLVPGGGSIESLGTFSNTMSSLFNHRLIKEGTNWQMLGMSKANKKVGQLNFVDQCTKVSMNSSTAFEPAGVTYTEPGSYVVELLASSSNGNTDYASQEVTVQSSQAPDIDFSTSNQCVGALSSFTSINTSGDISSYSWDFDGDGIEDSTDPDPTFQYSSAGEYEVTLTVQNEGGCSNTSRQIIGIYDISEPDFGFTYKGGLCSNNTLSFKDLTPNLPPDSLVTWTWDFNGEATILGKDTTYAFATAGEKIITLTVGIPGCEASVRKTINLLEGPTVGFTVGSNCISPTTQFNNTTTGDGITGYTWDFGNGYTSSVENPETFFETIGDYQVSLTVTNDLGCETTFTEKVAISAIPKPDFKHDLACSGAAVQFTDQSTAENANITEWSWDFAGLGTSNERNPIFEFPTAGKYTVTLSVSSNYGCSKILTREIDVLPSPTVAFLVNTGCEGQATTFVDQSTSDADNPIVDRLWSINNQFYSAPTVNEVFKKPGSYDVTLQITTKNLCTVSLTKTLQVNELPSIDFGFASACVNELTEFNDLSTSPDDPIISRKWDFAGQASANGPKAYYQFKQAGNYNVSLFLKTEKGCEISISKNVTINNSPVAAFSHSLSVGQLPVTVNFTNESNGATAYSWFVGDGVASVSNEQDISRVFDKEGDYLVSLVAFNEFGCSDTTTSVVTVALPKIDLQLRSVNYTDTDGKLRFILSIANRGSIAQTNFPIEIVVDDRVTISEKYNGTVAPGKSVSHSLQFELVIANSPVEKVCIKLVPILKDGEFEFSPQDNSNCLSFTEGFLVNNPYPNPVDDRLTFELILPEAGDAEVTVLSMTGQPMFSEKYYALKAGLTSLSLQMAHFNKGIYLLRVQSKGNEAIRRIVKR